MGPACCSESKQNLQNRQGYTLARNKVLGEPQEPNSNQKLAHKAHNNADFRTPSSKKIRKSHEITLSPQQTSSSSQENNKYGKEIVLTPQQQSLRKRIQQTLILDRTYQLSQIKMEHDKHSENIAKDYLKKSKAKWEDFMVFSYLGKGSLGEVFLGQKRDDFADQNAGYYAIKRVQLSNVNWKKLKENFKVQNELKMNPKQRQFFVQQFHAMIEKEKLCLVMQFAPGSSIGSFTKIGSSRNQFLKESGDKVIRFILGCAVIGLQFLHSKSVVYQDLKPDNLLVFDDGYIKMADFGVSHKMREGSYYLKPGILCYFAPEMIFGIQCEQYVDLWALGVLAYQLAFSALPFSCDQLKDSSKYMDKIKEIEDKRSWSGHDINPDLKDLISSLLRLEPRERLGAEGWHQIKNHKYFRGNGFSWQSLQNKQCQSPLLQGVYSDIIQKKAQFNKIKVDKKGSLFTIEQMFSSPLEDKTSKQ